MELAAHGAMAFSGKLPSPVGTGGVAGGGPVVVSYSKLPVTGGLLPSSPGTPIGGENFPSNRVSATVGPATVPTAVVASIASPRNFDEKKKVRLYRKPLGPRDRSNKM